MVPIIGGLCWPPSFRLFIPTKNGKLASFILVVLPYPLRLMGGVDPMSLCIHPSFLTVAVIKNYSDPKQLWGGKPEFLLTEQVYR